MRFDKKKLQNIEYILPLIMLALFLIGIVAITIATANPFTGEELTFSEIMANLDFSVVGLQGAFFAVGLVVMVLIMLVDYRLYAKIWYAVLAAGVVLLLLVVFFGKTRGGTQGWIYLNASGSITFQPSELVKLAMILVCAKFMADRPMERFIDVLPAAGVFVLIIAVLLYQMDIGTTIVYVAAFVGMAFMAGVKLRYIGAFGLAGAAFGVFAWFVLMGDRQRSRIINFFSGGEGDDFLQLNRSIAIIGSGGFAGKGLFSVGALSQLNYIPVIETDFIFVAIAESFGFLGCFFLLLVYATFIFRMWYLARITKDKFGALIIYGIMFMFMFHIFENIGMTIGIMPITGIPLPFISKGGTNLVTNMAAVGLVLSVRFHRELTEKESI